MPEKLPFHQSILNAIARAADLHDLIHIDMLLEDTKIPEGHQEIIDALKERIQSLDLEESGFKDTFDDLRAQAEEAARVAAVKEQTTDDLQVAVSTKHVG